MPTSKRPRDPNQLAYQIMLESAGQERRRRRPGSPGRPEGRRGARRQTHAPQTITDCGEGG